MPRISIVIPVYNTKADLLECCINSLRMQTYKDFEIILVDDGSDELVRKQLDEIAETSRSISVLHKENGGAASARAQGIKQTDSECLAFVDSDDEVEPYFLEEAIERYHDGFEIVASGITNYYHGQPIEKHQSAENVVARGESEVGELLSYYVSGGCPRKFSALRSLGSKALVSKLYKRSLFEGVECLENGLIFGEDVLVNVAAISQASSVCICRGLWYRRNINVGSTSYSYHENGINEALRTAVAMRDYASGHPSLIDAARTYALTCFNLGMESQVFHPESPISFLEKVRLLKHYIHEPIVEDACENCRYDLFEKSGSWDLIRLTKRLHTYFLAALIYEVRNRGRWQ